jgi:glycosyltransferase involved in cell wall biosynthesis
MRLTVLNVSYPLAPVSDCTAGGAEQVLAILDAGLVRGGHRSVVFAPEGSRCRGLLIPTPRAACPLTDAARRRAQSQYREALVKVLARFSIDVVHLHGVDFLEYLPDAGIPIVVTLHLPPDWYPSQAFHLRRPETYIVCVSQWQRRASPPRAPIHSVIENGVPLDRFHPARRKGNYVVCMGRICPEKGFHLAMDAAERAGMRLLLAGAVYPYPAHQAYFEQLIRPRLDCGHRLLGPVGNGRKQSLLAGAKCLLIPSLVPETSSLVAMEAMACGTPVIAYRKGALNELVQHGRTGFLVNNVAEMAEAIAAAAELNSVACRREAEARFSSQQMIEKYLQLYKEAAGLELTQHTELVEVLC